jgi:hypothetical protein
LKQLEQADHIGLQILSCEPNVLSIRSESQRNNNIDIIRDIDSIQRAGFAQIDIYPIDPIVSRGLSSKLRHLSAGQ